MAFLIRKINYKKWLGCKALNKEKYHADAITACTRTSGNTLSVWRSEIGELSVNTNREIITAIATIMNKLDLLDLVILKEEDFISNGIELEKTSGDSKIESLNDLHRDLANIDYEKLGFVAEKIVEAINTEGKLLRMSKEDVVDVLYHYYGDSLSDSPLDSSLKRDVLKKLENNKKATQ
ncbi:hypothetical protein ACK32Q_10190 [Aeromonas dhakensis]|uniref:hypothetical protein n=1 Tax=Aeromonas dhakensis TaxID=196024 RepID=UPI00398582E9